MSLLTFVKFIRENKLFSILFCASLLPALIFGIFNPGFLILVLILGAVGIVKTLEWVDDRHVDTKIGGWIDKQQLIFVKIIPKATTNYTCIDMEKFFLLLHATYGNRSQKNMRIEGKYFEEYSLELHSNGGVVSMYIKLYKNSLQTFLGATKLYFEDITFEISEDPFKTWPKTWQQAKENWKVYDGGEFGLAGKEIFPIKFSEQIRTNNQFHQKTPINQLVSVLQSVKDDYVCIQLIIRPQDSTNKKEAWNKELSKLKKDLAANSAVSISNGGSVNPYTPQEISLIESCERKIAAPCFDTKIRFVLLGKETTGKKYLSSIMAYWKNFSTEKQAIVPKPKSWDESSNATFGPFWDQLYWKPEGERRTRIFYKGMLMRSIYAGGPSTYWDVHSLASIFQFPNISFEVPTIVQEIEANTANNSENLTEANSKGKVNLDDKIRELKQKYSKA